MTCVHIVSTWAGIFVDADRYMYRHAYRRVNGRVFRALLTDLSPGGVAVLAALGPAPPSALAEMPRPAGALLGAMVLAAARAEGIAALATESQQSVPAPSAGLVCTQRCNAHIVCGPHVSDNLLGGRCRCRPYVWTCRRRSTSSRRYQPRRHFSQFFGHHILVLLWSPHA